jgi:hypothetical protein
VTTAAGLGLERGACWPDPAENGSSSKRLTGGGGKLEWGPCSWILLPSSAERSNKQWFGSKCPTQQYGPVIRTMQYVYIRDLSTERWIRCFPWWIRQYGRAILLVVGGGDGLLLHPVFSIQLVKNMGNQGHRMRFESVKLKAVNSEISHQWLVLSGT